MIAKVRSAQQHTHNPIKVPFYHLNVDAPESGVMAPARTTSRVHIPSGQLHATHLSIPDGRLYGWLAAFWRRFGDIAMGILNHENIMQG